MAKKKQTGPKAKKKQSRSVKAGGQDVQKPERGSTSSRAEVRQMNSHHPRGIK